MYWRGYWSKRGRHIHVRIFVGPKGQGGNCGRLVMREDEFENFKRMGSKHKPIPFEFVQESASEDYDTTTWRDSEQTQG